MRALLTAIVVAALTAPTVFAHTPQNCVALFHRAAKLNETTVRVGDRVHEAMMEMMDSRVGSHRDRYRRYDSRRVEQVADLFAQFSGVDAEP